MLITIPGPVEKALSMLSDAGYEAYIVGGCVRDCLLGQEPKDYDITTNALPTDVERIFTGERVIETGLKHGTVTVGLDGMYMEVTTYRVESGYSDRRHPDSVTFTRSLRDDAARRDFTINAMAYSPREGMKDFFGGQDDLRDRVIRCVGDPEKRFNEDALRILRALRFSSCLGFQLHDDTDMAVRKYRNLINNVSRERVASELIKLICGHDVRRVLTSYPDVLSQVVPEIAQMKGFEQHNPHHIYDVLTHTAVVAENVPPEPVLRLAALLHDCGKPATFYYDGAGIGHFRDHASVSVTVAEKVADDLRLDNETKNELIRLVKWHDVLIPPEKRNVKRWLGRMGEKSFSRLMALKRADNIAQSPEYRDRLKVYDEISAIASEIIKKHECFSLKDLAVNGSDLKELGMKPGKELGDKLAEILELVIAGTLPNERDVILRHVEKTIK